MKTLKLVASCTSHMLKKFSFLPLFLLFRTNAFVTNELGINIRNILKSNLNIDYKIVQSICTAECRLFFGFLDTFK